MNNILLEKVDHNDLFRMKWEYEKDRTGYDDLLDFGTADMDFRSPKPLLDALSRVIKRGHLGYPMLPDAYYDAIHDWLVRKTNWDIDARACIEHNVGIYMAVFNALDSMTDIGDRVTILTPVHFCFRQMINLNGRIAIECALEEEEGVFKINFNSLEACLCEGTKVLWLCNPHNPVGRAWSKKDLQKIADLCVKHDVLIFSDDVYCDLLYEGFSYTAIASLSKEISQRTITFYSPSKAFNVTGLRHSFTVTENPELMKLYRESMERVDLNYGMSLMGIAATIAAYNECDAWIEELMKQVSENYTLLSQFCQKHMPDIKVAKANATYFAWLDMRCLGIPDPQIGYLIEQEEHVIVENGLQLGKGGGGFIRMNLATTKDTLKEGLTRMKHFYEEHR